jgi:hypothetical protein
LYKIIFTTAGRFFSFTDKCSGKNNKKTRMSPLRITATSLVLEEYVEFFFLKNSVISCVFSGESLQQRQDYNIRLMIIRTCPESRFCPDIPGRPGYIQDDCEDRMQKIVRTTTRGAVVLIVMLTLFSGAIAAGATQTYLGDIVKLSGYACQ